MKIKIIKIKKMKVKKKIIILNMRNLGKLYRKIMIK